MKQFHKAIVNIWFNLNILETNQSNAYQTFNLPCCFVAESAWVSVSAFRKWTANYKFDRLV